MNEVQTSGTVRQVWLWNVCDSLEVVMTSVAKMGRAKAEKDSHGAAVAALVFQEIRSMLWADLKYSIQVQFTNIKHTVPLLAKEANIIWEKRMLPVLETRLSKLHTLILLGRSLLHQLRHHILLRLHSKPDEKKMMHFII